MEFWIKTEIGGGSLAVTDAHFFKGWDYYEPSAEC
jgi:hypothetical protein